MNFEQIKNAVLAALATVGSAVIAALGGWDSGLLTLVIFMACDYITGLACALVFKNSPKTADGAGSSRAGFTGLVKKAGILLCVMIAARLDAFTAADCCRDAVILFFIGNEGISVTENLGLMGVPLPGCVKRALELLREKGGAASVQDAAAAQTGTAGGNNAANAAEKTGDTAEHGDVYPEEVPENSADGNGDINGAGYDENTCRYDGGFYDDGEDC